MSGRPPPALVDHVCPNCGYRMNAATEVNSLMEDKPSPMPSPGDLSLCLASCGEWSVFDANLRLRVPTDEELISIGLNLECQALRMAWVRMNEERLDGKIKKRGAGWSDLG